MQVEHLGTVEYRTALTRQEAVRAQRQAGEVEDTLLLLEHPPVLTRGRRSEPGELAMGEAWYRAQGIDVVDVDRGGKLTYHAPGQLVGYPIVRISDVVGFVRQLEEGLIDALGELDLGARSRCTEGPAWTGVWVGERKVASIGVHVQKGVTTHGFALNVDMDLQPFDWVVACGLPDVRMTSVSKELGRRVTIDEALPVVERCVTARLAQTDVSRAAWDAVSPKARKC